MEYFVEMTTHAPVGTPEEAVKGRLVRLWAPLSVDPNGPVNGTRS
jgi:hypothetical protein